MASETDDRPTWEGPEYAALRPILYGQAMFQTLVAGCRLDLFTHLSREPGGTLDEITAALKLPRHSARLLLLACCSIRLVDKREGRYFNSATSEKLLVRGRPNNALSLVLSGHYLQYLGLYHLTESLEQGRNVGVEMYEGTGQTIYERMNDNRDIEGVLYGAMETILRLAEAGLDDKPELAETKYLIDVGGGPAAVALLLHERYPHLRIGVFDRETCCELGRENIRRAGKESSVSMIPGDMFQDPFPRGADGFIFCHLLEEFSREDGLVLLRKAYDALPEGGRVFLWNFGCDDEERGDIYSARLSLYFAAVATGSGMAYPAREFAEWFEEAGFRDIRTYSGLPFEHIFLVGHK